MRGHNYYALKTYQHVAPLKRRRVMQPVAHGYKKNIKVTQPPPDVYQAEREWCSYALLARQLSSDFLAPGHPVKPASCAWPASLVQSEVGETKSTVAKCKPPYPYHRNR